MVHPVRGCIPGSPIGCQAVVLDSTPNGVHGKVREGVTDQATSSSEPSLEIIVLIVTVVLLTAGVTCLT